MIPESDSSSSLSTPPVFVTGSAGHVGANLVRRLLEEGVRIRVLLRHEDNNEGLEGLDVERSYGDLRDLNATRQAITGCQGVYHVAAQISTIEGNRAHRRKIFECNVIGTRNVLQAAREAEAGRVVVTGSFSAVGHDLDNPSAPSDETMPFFPMERTMPYERSKSLVEQECWSAAAAGQDVVVATCCAVVGGADFLPSRLGRTLCDYTNGKLHAYVDGGFEFVAARDIVEVRAKNTSSAASTRLSQISWIFMKRSRASRGRVGGFHPTRCWFFRRWRVLILAGFTQTFPNVSRLAPSAC
ncbi:MAG: NAD-dependent epimerase/dehydratase family protein [Rhodospirillaceae bacterium]|nr:NAD-dependent epimerase/dehydratase family protein [Rhodospirillaceae bacterium]